MPLPIATTLTNILQALELQLVTANIFDASSIFVTLNPEGASIKLPIGDMFCGIVVGRQHVRQNVVTGGGNIADAYTGPWVWMDGRLEFWLWTRLALDRAGHVDDWYTNASLGIIELHLAVITNLQQCVPLDSSNNPLLLEPMRMVSTDFKYRTDDNVGRASAIIDFEVSYMQKIS